MTTRVAVLLLVLANLLALPFALEFLFFVLLPFNPMLTVFVTDFEVRNRTTETIRVTPIGATERAGQRVLLPMYERHWPATLAESNRDLEIPPGGVLRAFYDQDDCMLAEILVRRASGEIRQMTVSNFGNGPISNYRGAHEDVSIVSLDDLPLPDPSVLAPLERAGARAFRRPGAARLSVWPLVVLVTGILVFRELRRRLRGPGQDRGKEAGTRAEQIRV